MADFFKEYFYDMSDRLGGYPAGGDNKRSNTARWIDIINGLAFLPMQQQGVGTPGLPGMNGLFGLNNTQGGIRGIDTTAEQQMFAGNNYQAPSQDFSVIDRSQYAPTRNILREIYSNPRAYDTDAETQIILDAIAKNNY